MTSFAKQAPCSHPSQQCSAKLRIVEEEITPTPGAVLADSSGTEVEHGTQEEVIHAQNSLLNVALCKDLTEQVLEMDQNQFEQLVVALVVAMGHGGSVVGAGWAIGRSNDGGIDGVIREDVLDRDTIYVRASMFFRQSWALPCGEYLPLTPPSR